jgi:hypothetical protein
MGGFLFYISVLKGCTIKAKLKLPEACHEQAAGGVLLCDLLKVCFMHHLYMAHVFY